MFGVFLSATGQAHIIPMDTVRTNQMPNMGSLYQNERNSRFAHTIMYLAENHMWLYMYL